MIACFEVLRVFGTPPLNRQIDSGNRALVALSSLVVNGFHEVVQQGDQISKIQDCPFDQLHPAQKLLKMRAGRGRLHI